MMGAGRPDGTGEGDEEARDLLRLKMQALVAVIHNLSARPKYLPDAMRLRAMSRELSRMATRLLRVPVIRRHRVADAMLRAPYAGRHLIELDASDNPEITDAGVSGLANLRVLDASKNAAITNAGVRGLANLRTLKVSNNYMITNAAIFHLDADGNEVDHFPRLTSLDASITGAHPGGIADDGIARLLALEHLRAGGANSRISDYSVAKLAKLRTLDAPNNPNITSVALSGTPLLEHLDASGQSGIGDGGLARLANLTSLVVHANARVTDASIRALTGLTKLDVSGTTAITGDAVRHLKALTRLNLLDAEGIGDEPVEGGLPLLAVLPRLTVLAVGGTCRVTDASLARATGLTELVVWDTDKITRDVLAHMPRLKKVTM